MATDRIAEIRAREAADSELLSRAPESSDYWDDATWRAWARIADRVHAAQPTVSQLQDRIAELESVLAERDEQIAYLIAAEPTLDDDQPAAPR